WKYMVNRALRIFPLYWLTIAACWLLVTHYPQQVHEAHGMFGMPQEFIVWLTNLFAIGMSHPLVGLLVVPALLPVAWSLGVELIYWLAMPSLLTHRAARLSLLGIAICYAIAIAVVSAP